MSTRYSNNNKLPISLAVWLASDTYDKQEAGLSVTTLLKPIRQIILSQRVPEEDQVSDVMSMLASRRGTAIHNSVEDAWVNYYAKALKALGYPQGLIDRVRINPDPATLTPDDVPVYLEKRVKKDVLGVPVSGQYDFVIEGCVEDIKTTSIFSYMSGNKDSDYILQGSLYRWLNPEIITGDVLKINFIFSDWQKARAIADPVNYPQAAIVSKAYKLLPIEEAERFVTNKVAAIQKYVDTPEDMLPLCSDKELWRSDPVYKYYKNPDNRARSTKNFDSIAEANKRLVDDGNVGVVITVPGAVKACLYCPAFSVCTQKDRLIASGDLVM